MRKQFMAILSGKNFSARDGGNILRRKWFGFFRVKNEFSSPKVLDIGCGQGACSWFMAKEGGQETAFDGSPTGLQNVSEIAKEFGVANKFNLVLGDITSPGKFISETLEILLDNYSLYSNPEENICSALFANITTS